MVGRGRIISCSLVLILLLLGTSPLTILIRESISFDIIGRVDASFEGGDGSVSDPFLISNVNQLQNISFDLDAHYKIINDIDASDTENWNDGKGFDPLGETGNFFKGSLDGGNYEIRSLCINRRFQSRVGLIGFSMNASISNVIVDDVFVRGLHRVGGLVGVNYNTNLVNCSSSGDVESLEGVTGVLVGWNNGIIDNCSSKGNIRGTAMEIGGLVGDNNYGGLISNCYSSTNVRSSNSFCGGIVGATVGDIFNCQATGDVFGDNYVGGLVGYQGSGNIRYCNTSGIIKGNEYVGGLAGLTRSSVFNCYSVGNVTGNISVGGLIGNIDRGNVSNCYAKGNIECQTGGGFVGKNNGTCSDCYSVGDIVCDFAIEESLYLGGFVGNNTGSCRSSYSSGNVSCINENDSFLYLGGFSGINSATIQDCYWDYESSGLNTSDGGIPKSTAEMREVETFNSANWNFEETWDIFEGISYPFFIGHYHAPIILSEIPNATEDEYYEFEMESKLCFLPGCDNNPEYLLTSNPEYNWLLISRSGLLYGTPSGGDVDKIWVNITVIDLPENTDRKNFKIEVVNTNDDPVILTETLSNAFEEIPYWIEIVGSDEDPTLDVLTWEITNHNGAEFLSIDEVTGNLTGIPDEDDVGTYNLNISVSDGNGGNGSRIFELTVLDVNDPPVIIGEDTVSIFQGMFYDISYSAVDQDDQDIFKWFLTTDAAWLTMDNETGRLYGTPENDDVGIFYVNITAEDLRGGRTSRNFSLEVKDVNDAPEFFKVPADTNVLQGSYFYFELEAIDIDDPQIFTWSLNTDAVWLSIEKETGIISGIPDNDDVGSFFVNITVEDQREGSNNYNFTITVEDQNDPPQWVKRPQDSVVKEGDHYSFDVDAVDIDDGDIIFYGISSKPMTDISIDITTGMITWSASLNFFTPPYNVLSVTINISDGDEVLSYKFSISVIENSTTSDPSNPEPGDCFDSKSVLFLMILIILLLIGIGITLVLIRMKNMDRSEEKTVSTILFGSKSKEATKDIFISYAQNDKDTAFKICDMLEGVGFGCWIAPRDILPGQNWGKSIIKGINDCKLMIMVFSEHSNESVQVLREIERAVHKKIPIIIFRIADIDPSEEYEYYVSAVHWLDAVSEPLELHIDKLKEIVYRSFDEMQENKMDSDQEEE